MITYVRNLEPNLGKLAGNRSRNPDRKCSADTEKKTFCNITLTLHEHTRTSRTPLPGPISAGKCVRLISHRGQNFRKHNNKSFMSRTA